MAELPSQARKWMHRRLRATFLVRGNVPRGRLKRRIFLRKRLPSGSSSL
jgi:hypothetical protein